MTREKNLKIVYFNLAKRARTSTIRDFPMLRYCVLFRTV